MRPVLFRVTPAAMSKALKPPANVIGLEVAKEFVTRSAAGTVAEAPLMVIAPLATVSPSCALLLTPKTPALIVTDATGLIPLRTIVPIPALSSAPAPLNTLLPA